jgi:D-ornithine 4,5-aminomutase subunit beta
VGAGTTLPRAPDYGAPVCSHFGANAYAEAGARPCEPIGGCTLCDPSKIPYVDELDPEDNVEKRLERPLAEQAAGWLRPEVEKAGDGVVCVSLFLPAPAPLARAAALELARRMGLREPEVIHQRVLHPAEGSVCEVKGVLDQALRIGALEVPEREARLPHAEIEAFVRPRNLHVVAATVGEDEHSVGLQEILDLKHGGIERYGFRCHYLGTSVSLEALLEAAEAHGAGVVLISTIVTHRDVHRESMRRLAALAEARGLRGRLLLIGGGTQVDDALARECGLDAGFGRGTTGQDVASFIVRRLREAEGG